MDNSTVCIEGITLAKQRLLLHVRTNYGIFNIKFAGAKAWNSLDSELKTLSIETFKSRLREKFVSNY